jgi:hypothetical protein
MKINFTTSAKCQSGLLQPKLGVYDHMESK